MEYYLKKLLYYGGVKLLQWLKRINLNFIILIIILLSVFLSVNVLSLQNPLDVDIEVLREEFERIYNVRSNCLVTGDTATLKELFDTSQKYGIYSLDHEVKRVKYLKDWSIQRGIQFKNVESFVRIKKVLSQGTVIKVLLEESYRFDYVYEDDPDKTLNSFGVGIKHTAKITKKQDKWLIYQDWYTDCFEDALQSYTADAQNVFSKFNFVLPLEGNLLAAEKLYDSAQGKTTYNREKAVSYADKYCGAAWGSGNDFKYNPKYMDYNGAGGDCTNYASQVLGDEEAGGLSQDGTWFCSFPKYGRGSGSSAWVNADALKNYLIYSGKTKVIKSGTYKELTTPSTDTSETAISNLCLGDVICYEKGRGNIDHFAVVTGFDSKGYPLVNSHTTDRYHVPWDLGWGDKKIRFFLLHVN